MTKAADMANMLSNGVGTQTGTIMTWSNSTLPSGFLECDGSNVSRTTYADLFAVIGTDYGVGDGSSTFTLPDLQDKVHVGSSSGKAVASTGGAESVTPTGSVANHTLTTSQMPQHQHSVYPHAGYVGGGTSGAGGPDGFTTVHNGTTGPTGSGGAHNHGLTVNSVSVLQPYIAMKFMIKT